MKWMLLYGVVIVVVGQLFWIVGLRAVSVSTTAIVGSFASITGIPAAYLILGEVPTQPKWDLKEFDSSYNSYTEAHSFL
jgi:drug/metabolite transporter (DMT)-like permease